MTVSCSACGQEWDRDPALEVTCPTCNARIGTYCSEQRPSGYRIRFGSTLIHPARDQAAMDFGLLQRCPAAQKHEDPDNIPLFASCQPSQPLLERVENDGVLP
jgi:hypothetical protein